MNNKDYQRAYNKGYATGSKLNSAISDANLIVMDGLVERAERAEAGLGIGKCRDCRHWRREHGDCKWGACTLTERGVHITSGWPWRGNPEQRIDTQENFGCIRFQTPAPPSKQEG